MAGLSQSDLQGVLAFLGKCESFPDVESLRRGMLGPLAEVVADHAAFVRWGHQHPIDARRSWRSARECA